MDKKNYGVLKRKKERLEKKIRGIDNKIKVLNKDKEGLLLELDKNNLQINEQVFEVLNIEPVEILDRLSSGINIETILNEIKNNMNSTKIENYQ